jgi:uncharacterized protein
VSKPLLSKRTPSRPLAKPLADDDYETLAELLDRCSPYDIDGVLGVLHAVAVAPGLIPPPTWLRIIVPKGGVGTDEETRKFSGLLDHLFNDVTNALEERRVIIPEEDDAEGCDSFATGFLAAALTDPVWLGDENHWTFTSWAAYLTGKHELISPPLLKKMEEVGDARKMTYKFMDSLVLAADETFRKVRRETLSPTAPTSPASFTTRVGRNEPCPCGSGKKYKKCCIGQETLVRR